MLNKILQYKDLRRCKFTLPGCEPFEESGRFHRWATIKTPHFIERGVIGPRGETPKLKRHVFTQDTVAYIEDKKGFIHQVDATQIKFISTCK